MDQMKSIFLEQFQPERLSQLFEDRISESHTVGKDGVTPFAFGKNLEREIQLISERVLKGSYKYTTYKQRLILKSSDKPPRSISIATVRDRIALRALTHVLTQIYPSAAQLPAHAIITEIKYQIESLDDKYSFVQIDVENFYPTVSHSKLRRTLRSHFNYAPFMKLIMSAISTSTGDKAKITNKGIPQGLSISNVLSSVYMLDFDKTAKESLTYYRYVDDILIISKTNEATDVYKKIKLELKKISLKCHPLELNKKTKIVPLSKGVDYLGYNIKPKFITVRTSSYKRMIENIMRVITAVKYEKTIEKH